MQNLTTKTSPGKTRILSLKNKHRYILQVQLSFLMVGHTHEDVDQVCDYPNICSKNYDLCFVHVETFA